MKIGICSDHAGFELKSIVEGYLEANNREYKDFGTYSAESCDYADFAHPCALAVESGECYPGIAMCGSGNGIAMTLNKHQGIRAALCWNTELASRPVHRAGAGSCHCRHIPAHGVRGWTPCPPHSENTRALNGIGHFVLIIKNHRDIGFARYHGDFLLCPLVISGG